MMAALGGQILTMFCGFTLTLIMFSLSMAIQSLPTILRLMEELVRVAIQFSADVYRKVCQLIYPEILTHKDWWILTSIVLSFSLGAGITYLLTQHLKIWPLVLAFFHGLAVGLDGNDDNDHHLHLGTDL